MLPLEDTVQTRRPPIVTYGLMGVCFGVFLHEMSLDEGELVRLVETYGAVPVTALAHPYALLTSQFFHGGLLHLLGNLWFLRVFGRAVEDTLGHLSFLLFYLYCGLIAALCHAIVNPHSTIPMIGASGAISGVLGAYYFLFPEATILSAVFFGPIMQLVQLPATLFLGLWLIVQSISAMAGTAATGGVAWYAHLGGFLAGLAVAALFFERREEKLSAPL